MSQGKEWWIPRIAGAITFLALWVPCQFWVQSQEGREVLALWTLSLLLPNGMQALVAFLLRIRLAAPFDETSNAVVND